VLPSWEADGIILGSPTYLADLSPELKALIDRTGYVSMRNGGFSRKVELRWWRCGAAEASTSRLHQPLAITQMVTVGSTYRNLGYGATGEVKTTKRACTMANLGGNMAWLLGKLAE
jgi:multimeric flavodoxin WrbA